VTRMRKFLVVVLLSLASISAWAQFPGLGGLIVHDPLNEVHLLVQVGHMVTTINQLVQTYQMITAQYNHMKYMAKYLENQYRYHAVSTVWHGLSGTNTYGRTGAWLTAVNQGTNADQAWLDAAVRTLAYPGGLAGWAAGQEKKQKDFATVELMNASSVNAIDTVGRIRSHGPQVETAMAQLEEDTLSQDPDKNTFAAQQNKTNAIGLVNTKQLMDTNKLLVTNAELSLMRTKQEHDAAAAAIIADGALRQDGAAALQTQHSGASEQMSSYRIP
jgi:hypothetical protein